jgi:predicted ATPase
MIDEEQNASLARQLGLSPILMSLSYLPEAWWMRGYPERGYDHIIRAFKTAEALDHGPSIEFAVGYQAEFYQLLGDQQKVLSVADESLRLAAIQRSEFWQPMITVYQGWAIGALGDIDEGISMMEDGLRRYRAAGNGITQIHLLAMLAEGYLQSQHWDETLSICADADKISARTGECYFLPEIHRIRAQVFWHTSRALQARETINTAMAIAEQQSALSLSLRAAINLCQFSHDDGSRREAVQLLANLLDQFTEGFDTPDLIQAATLKRELAD